MKKNVYLVEDRFGGRWVFSTYPKACKHTGIGDRVWFMVGNPNTSLTLYATEAERKLEIGAEYFIHCLPLN